MAETSAATVSGPVHSDCPTCACGKRAPVQPGGSISWGEHEMAWSVRARALGQTDTPEEIAERGGFTIGELTEFLGRQPSTWRATPAERVVQDFVEVFEDTDGQFRWRRKNGNNHQVISGSGEGYKDEGWAAKMAQRVNPNCEVKILTGTTRPAPDPATADRPSFPAATGPATPEQPLGGAGAVGEGYIDATATDDEEPRPAVDESAEPLPEGATHERPSAAPLDGPPA